MRLLSWNVQWCRGLDGRVDAKRIAREARQAQPDVICLQEIARHFPQMAGSAGEDQVEELQRELPGYQAFFGTGVDLPGATEGRNARRQFGNLVLSRLPVGRVLRHQLPWPAAADVQSMPRVAVEVVVGEIHVITTHLEYYSAQHREAQIQRLHEIHREACAPHKLVEEPGSYESYPRGKSALVCGDFNLKPEAPEYRQMLDGGFVDAWAALNPGQPRQATFHLYDGETPYCCDYIFVTPDLVPRLKSIRIDTATQASDHQPLILDLA